MIGHIESYDAETQTGVVKHQEHYYGFHIDDWQSDVAPDVDDDVSFDIEDGAAKNVNLVGAYLEPPKAVKYKYLAALLSMFGGFAGLGRLYLGYYRLALIQIAVTLTLLKIGGPGFTFLWGFVESVLLFGGHINKDAKGRPLK